MTKEEYIAWKQTRGEASTWDRNKCRAADELIKETTLANFREILRGRHIDPSLKKLLKTMVGAHFGSIEVDEAMIALKCYPDWL